MLAGGTCTAHVDYSDATEPLRQFPVAELLRLQRHFGVRHLEGLHDRWYVAARGGAEPDYCNARARR